MAKHVLKPLSYVGLIDETFDLYKRNFVVLVAVHALSLITVFCSYTMPGKSHYHGPYSLIPLYLRLFPLLLIQSFISAASNKTVSDCYLRQNPGFTQSYKSAFHIIVPLFVTLFVIHVAGIIGLLFCLIPGIVIAVWSTFVNQVVILEGKGYYEAFKRSKDLAKGEAGRIILVFMMIVIGLSILHYIFVVPIDLATKGSFHFWPENSNTWGKILRAIYGLFAGPILSITMTLLYYDIRVRKEGFDVRMLNAGKV